MKNIVLQFKDDKTFKTLMDLVKIMPRVKVVSVYGTEAAATPVPVDLGLPSGTLWADRNLGASGPEAPGDYYLFGETRPVNRFRRLHDISSLPAAITGDASYDAARADLGEGWQMPTFEQVKELKDCCNTAWDAHRCAMEFIGLNGNSIFLPVAAFRHDVSVEMEDGICGSYWSSDRTPGGGYRMLMTAKSIALSAVEPTAACLIRPVTAKTPAV